MSGRAPLVSTLVALALLWAPGALCGQQSAEARLQAAIYKQQVEGDVRGAIALFGRIATEDGGNRRVAAQALLHLGLAYETLGTGEAESAYRRLLRDYPDQADAANQARDRLTELAPRAAPARERPDGPAARLLSVIRTAWTGPGSLAPDASKMAVIDWGVTDEWKRDNTGDVVVVDTETGDYRIVGRTGSGREDGDTYGLRGIWSRDGQRIAYSVWSSQWDRQLLRIVNADGTNDRVVSDNSQLADLRPAAWSADGSFIAALIMGWDRVLRIGKISTTDGTVTILRSLGTTLPGGSTIHDMSLSLSPDDRFVAYAYSPTPTQKPEVHVLAVDGSGEHVVAASEVGEANPHWTPDGRRLVFLSDRSGSTGLWSVEMRDGQAVGEPELIRPHTGPVMLLGFTTDGALAYQSPVPEQHLRVRTIDWTDGRFVDEGEPLTGRFVGYNHHPTWSPDGGKIAFLSRRPGPELGGSDVLVVRSLDDGTEREFELHLGLSGETRPEWSSDGRTVLLEAYRIDNTDAGSTRHRAAYRIDTSTGTIEEEPYIRDYAGFWRTEQARFASGRQSEGLRSLGVRLSGQRDLSSYLQDDQPLRPGESLLTLRGDGIHWVRAFGCEHAASYPDAVCNADEDVLLERLPGHSLAAGFALEWELSPDGTTIAYVWPDEDDSGPRGLWAWRISEDERPRRLVGALPRGAGAVRWMPDGWQILYHTTEDPDVATGGVYRVDAEGGEPERLDLEISKRQLGDLTIQPDGNRLVLSSGSGPGNGYRGEVWLLSGFPWDR